MQAYSWCIFSIFMCHGCGDYANFLAASHLVMVVRPRLDAIVRAWLTEML